MSLEQKINYTKPEIIGFNDLAPYNGEFIPETDLQAQIIANLENLLRIEGPTLLVVFPSLHRIQNIFGGRYELEEARLTLLVCQDLAAVYSFKGAESENLKPLVSRAVATLASIERELLLMMSLSERGSEEDDLRVQIRDEMIERIVWTSWKPIRIRGMVDILLKTLFANLKYLSLIKARKDGGTFSYDFSQEIEPLDELAPELQGAVVYNLSRRKGVAGRYSTAWEGYTAGAEAEYIRIETARELEELAKGTLVGEYLEGHDADGKYRSSLKKAYRDIEQRISGGNIPKLARQIREIVSEAQEFQPVMAVNRRVAEENNRVLRVINLANEGFFPPGSLTGRERAIVNLIVDYYTRQQKILNAQEIGRRLNWGLDEVSDVLRSLLDFKDSRPRYATREYPIAADTIYYQLLEWWRQHKEERKEVFLSIYEHALFKLAVELSEEGYYPTVEKLAEGLKEKGLTRQKKLPSRNIIYMALKRILKSLNSETRKVEEIEAELEAMKASIVEQKKQGEVLIIDRLLELIRAGESLGRGRIQSLARETGIARKIVAKIMSQAGLI